MPETLRQRIDRLGLSSENRFADREYFAAIIGKSVLIPKELLEVNNQSYASARLDRAGKE